MLPDGTYDAIVVDATEVDDQPDALVLELAVLDGPQKGEVVSVRARGGGLDALDALGVPATITVRDGEPEVVLEP